MCKQGDIRFREQTRQLLKFKVSARLKTQIKCNGGRMKGKKTTSKPGRKKEGTARRDASLSLGQQPRPIISSMTYIR